MSGAAHLPIIDIEPLWAGVDDPDAAIETGRSIDRACRDVGFFGVVGHRVPRAARHDLDAASRRFFALPDDRKRSVSMAGGGSAWRGWFPVGDELTAGRPDRKEGLYVGTEHAPDDPRVLAGVPLHGANRFPDDDVPELRPAVLDWLDLMRPVADAVLRGIAIGLGAEPDWFAEHLTGDPTILFRVFHYPPHAPDDGMDWGVAEHTDYGLLTLLAQDDSGGLEVDVPGTGWQPVAAEPGVLVCNLGDMLERLTGGRYRSTPHRVRNTSGAGRLSFPYFFDPSWDARVPQLPLTGSPPPNEGRSRRWDGADVTAWTGTYGDYLTAKVAKVFPELATGQSGSSSGTIRP